MAGVQLGTMYYGYCATKTCGLDVDITRHINQCIRESRAFSCPQCIVADQSWWLLISSDVVRVVVSSCDENWNIVMRKERYDQARRRLASRPRSQSSGIREQWSLFFRVAHDMHELQDHHVLTMQTYSSVDVMRGQRSGTSLRLRPF
jgi:hypothetical protein